MALLNQPIQVPGQIANFFAMIREGQAPDKFNREHLMSLGFTSSNHQGFLPLLKGLGFLTPDGTPTQRYREYLDATKSKKIMAEALREAYGDIFVIKARPSRADKDLITGKFRSSYNSSEVSADRAASTFLALLDLADETTLYASSASQDAPKKKVEQIEVDPESTNPDVRVPDAGRKIVNSTLHYNIQIHLPATKDLEVYNAIFKSLRAHILD